MSAFYRGRALDVATFVRWLGLVFCDWNAEATFHPNLPSFPRSFPETRTAGTGKGPAWRWAAGAARPASCRLSPGASAWVPAQLSPGAARGRGALPWISRPPRPCRRSYSEVGRGPWPGWARPGCARPGCAASGPAAEGLVRVRPGQRGRRAAGGPARLRFRLSDTRLPKLPLSSQQGGRKVPFCIFLSVGSSSV